MQDIEKTYYLYHVFSTQFVVVRRDDQTVICKLRKPTNLRNKHPNWAWRILNNEPGFKARLMAGVDEDCRKQGVRLAEIKPGRKDPKQLYARFEALR